MSWRRAVGLELILGSSTLVVTVPVSAQATELTTAFIDVSVVPMDRERVLRSQTVLVRDGRIVGLGPAQQVRVPANATHIDGRGKFLMPGLADMHVHLRPGRPGIADVLFLHLANGVTAIREMMSDTSIVALKREVAAGELLGPRIYAAKMLTKAEIKQPVEKIAGVVASIKAAGFDFIKHYNSAPDRERFDSLMVASYRVGIPVVGHVTFPGVGVALRTQVHSIEHLWGYPQCIGFLPPAHWPPLCEVMSHDSVMSGPKGPAEYQPEYRLDTARLRSIAAATQQAGVWNTPTLEVLDKKRAWRNEWHHQIVKALVDAGAGVLLGTDVPAAGLDGFIIHKELRLFIDIGLSPYQALETGTRNAAEALGVLDSAGTVTVGKRADLILLNENPLEDIRTLERPAGVVLAGRWISRADIEERLLGMVRDDHPFRAKYKDRIKESLREVRGLPVAP